MKVIDYLMHPSYFEGWLLVNKPHYFKNDKHFLCRKWRFLNHGILDLDNPQSFNEKLNWLKLYYRDPKLTMMADKYEVKKYVASIIGDKYVVPCYGVWDSFDEIDFSILPSKFVIKATHDSSGATVVRNRFEFDIDSSRKKYERIIKRNWFWPFREWVYKDIKPRIIVDHLLDDHSGHELRDYKFWCFNGIPKVMYCTNKAAEVFENFYDMDFRPLDINHGFPRHVPEFEKPEEFDEMKALAAELSQGIPFVRIDFFDVNGKVYFGEFTFYDWAGFKPFVTEGTDMLLGSWIDLPETKV